jgi:hypothetical protein
MTKSNPGFLGRSIVVAAGACAILAMPAAVVAHAGSASWAIVASKDSSKTQRNALDGVSCAPGKTTFCMAVGGYYTGTNPSVKHNEIQKWNGKTWTIVASPNATGSTVNSNFLAGVTCPTTTFCMAAGYDTRTGGLPDQTLILAWNGTAWSIVTSPNVSGVSNDLESVSCVNTTSCIAAGKTFNSSYVEQTLTEKWNGSVWSVVSSADTSSSQDNFLFGVSCPTTTFCMADGYYDQASGNQLTLAERWNGTSWSITSSPNPSSTFTPLTNSLWSVSCTSTTFCMAAGDYWNSGGVKQNLVEKWSGSSWAIVTTPDTSSAADNGLYSGVSCATTSFCMDSSQCCDNSGTNQTLTLEWTGSTWQIVASADTSSSIDNQLQATSCPTATFCFAVGQAGNTTPQNLIERWK